MVRFDGEKRLPFPPAVVWARLTDPSFLLTCLPDLGPVESVDTTTARFVLRPGLSFVRGTLNAHLTILEKTPEVAARYRVVAKGIGSSSTVELVLGFHAEEAGTLLRYEATISQLGGLLGLVPAGLIQGAARKVLTDVLALLEKRLAD